MASSAGLLQAMNSTSFDSALNDSSTVDQRSSGHVRRPGPSTTVGGITLGSVATSFHSEDEDERRAGDGPDMYGDRADARGATGGAAPYAWYGPASSTQDDSSLLAEQVVLAERAPARSMKVQQARRREATDRSRPASAVSNATASSYPARSAGGSTRLASASTAPTDDYGPDVRESDDKRFDSDLTRAKSKRAMASGVRQEWSTGQDESVEERDDSGALRGLDVDESRDSGKWSRTNGSASKKKGGLGQNMTLREQEKVIDEFKKENFDLKLKIHFYEQRLERLAPDQIDLALRENIQLKVEFQTLRTELKKYKKLLLEGNRAIEQLTRERDQAARSGGTTGTKRERETEKNLQREREDREILEARLREQARELRDLRESKRRAFGSHPDEEAEDEIERLRSELEAEREAREEALGDQDDLRNQLRELQDALDEARDEADRLRDSRGEPSGAAGHDDSSYVSARGGKRELERLQARLGDLEQDNASLRSQISAHMTMISARNAEKDALLDENDGLKEDLLRLENELDRQDRARGRDGVRSVADGDKTREDLEFENDEYRDRAAAHALQVERLENELADKEQEIEELLAELDSKSADQAIALRQLEEEIKGELEDAQAKEAQARDLLDEKEADIEGLVAKVETMVAELGDKEREMASDKEEVEALTHDLQKLGAQIFALEEEADEKDARIKQLEADLDAVDKDAEDRARAHEAALSTVRRDYATVKAHLDELTGQYDLAVKERDQMRHEMEELAYKAADLDEKSKADTDTKQRLEEEAVEIMRALRKEEEEHERDRQEAAQRRIEDEARWKKLLDERAKDLERAQSDIERFKDLVGIREKDVQGLQQALNGLEMSARRQGESHSSNQMALGLELDRLKRDYSRCEADLARAERDLEERSEALRESELAVASLQSENKDLSSQLASQTQIRLALTDKYDKAVKNLRDAQEDLATTRERLRNVDSQLNSGQRQLGKTETQFRDQLTERNSLLQTVYQYVDRVSPSVRRTGTEPRPHTNFNAFQDTLISRLKGIGQLQTSFERRAKDIEARFSDNFESLKRQQEARIKQLERFEAAIKSANDTQKQWRQRVHAKQAEVDSGKSVIADLQTQIAVLRASNSDDPAIASKISALSARASSAERKLSATQAQLADAETKLSEARTKVGIAEGKWEARLQELQARLRAAEEKIKRERQGAKERVAELVEQNGVLKDQIAGSHRRGDQLDDVLAQTERNKRASTVQ